MAAAGALTIANTAASAIVADNTTSHDHFSHGDLGAAGQPPSLLALNVVVQWRARARCSRGSSPAARRASPARGSSNAWRNCVDHREVQAHRSGFCLCCGGIPNRRSLGRCGASRRFIFGVLRSRQPESPVPIANTEPGARAHDDEAPHVVMNITRQLHHARMVRREIQSLSRRHRLVQREVGR